VAFAIIGLTGGRPYTANPCFLDEYRWAQRYEQNPAVYVNIDYPKVDRPEGDTGPYGQCAPGDEWCRAYNYGYGITNDVVSRAAAFRISPSMWWLDVETQNFWSGDPTYNAQVIRGVIDNFKERGLPAGIYGTAYQWRIIAGNAAYGLPIWAAGAQGWEEAASRCGDPRFAFAGGKVVLVQYYDYGFDTNFLCPANGLPSGGTPAAGTGTGQASGGTSPASPAMKRRSVIPMVAVNR
jgi:hypothetical protein